MIISPTKAAEAASVLEVSLEGLTANAVRRAYRGKAKLCHPDHHTDKAEEWARLSWATAALTHWVAKQPKVEPDVAKNICCGCGGTGRVAVRNINFRAPLTMQCTTCKGLGEMITEECDND